MQLVILAGDVAGGQKIEDDVVDPNIVVAKISDEDLLVGRHMLLYVTHGLFEIPSFRLLDADPPRAVEPQGRVRASLRGFE